jgi:glycosyltransferase involved in cell wall biosynthesis
MPKVSIIMPTHNREKYIPLSINSILKQTYRDYEIIVIDDNSTDGTKEALKVYGDKIRYFFRQGEGAAAARNFGAAQARGEYLAFLDDDDLWLPEHLAISVDLLEKNPDIAFSCADADTIDEHGTKQRTLIKAKAQAERFETLLEGNIVLNLTAVIRKKIFLDAGGFDPKLANKHDYDLWLRVSKHHYFLHTGRISAQYREHSNQLTGKIDIGLKNHLTIFNKPEIMSGVPRLLKHRAIARVFYRFGRDYHQRGQRKKAGKCFLLALSHCPWIGKYYWPDETKKMRFSLPYRILKLYWLGPYLWIKGVVTNQ